MDLHNKSIVTASNRASLLLVVALPSVVRCLCDTPPSLSQKPTPYPLFVRQPFQCQAHSLATQLVLVLRLRLLRLPPTRTRCEP
uniref:Putative secreted protein n=1 Tax=Anopheles triannulatus TaxID=58253 RepID=A0A2M4B7S4_9DIPT